MEKRRIVVLLVALCLAIMPQGVYWCQPEGLDYSVGIPYYLFHSAGELEIEDRKGEYILDCDTIEYESMVPMKVIAYLYVIVAIVLIIESIYEIVKKKDIKEVLEGTMKVFRGIAILQLVGSLLYVKKYISVEGDWYWMFGICVVQLFISIGIYVAKFGYVRYGPRSNNAETWRQMGYLWLCAISYVGACFQGLPLVDFDEEHSWAIANMFMGFPFGILDEEIIYNSAKVVSILFLVGTIVLTVVSGAVQERFNNRIHKVIKWVIIGYLGWICIAGLFVTFRFHVYFMPGILQMILMSWSCWRLAGASEREVW